jgi:hypothetical protein
VKEFKVNDAATGKLFGKYHDVLLLLFGFFLTTIVGGYLGAKYQERAWAHDLAAKRYDAQLDAASKVFDDISRLLDRRLYRARTLLWAYKGSEDEEEIQLRRKEYREVVEDWNGSLNRNLVLVERYFGPSLRAELEGDIAKGFKDIHNALDAYRKNPEPAKLAELERQIDSFNPTIYGFNLELLEHIQNGDIGQSPDSGAPIRRGV